MNKNVACKVVVAGGINLDIVATAHGIMQTDDSTPGGVQFSAGGVGRNIAEGLSRLSVNCRFYSLVGDDMPGELVLGLCRGAELATDCIVRCADESTPVYVSVNESTGAMLHAVSDMSLIDRARVDQFSHLKSDILSADLCVIDANLPAEMIEQVARYCGGTPLVADAVSVSKCRRLSAVLPAVDTLKVNYQEAVELAGIGEAAGVEALAEALLAQGPSTALISLGADGVMAATGNGKQLHTQLVKAPPASVVGINGAGDALLAGFIAARLTGLDLTEQLQWGVEAARLSLESTRACSELLTCQYLQQLTQQ